MKLPPYVFLNTTGDFKKFEETLKIVAEKNLYPQWDWSIKVGGKIQKEMLRANPDCFKGDPKVIEGPKQLKADQKHDEIKLLEYKNIAKNGKVAPPPPFRYQHITPQMAEIMGKKGWEVATMGETDRFFRLDLLDEESPLLLATRKEIWDWCVVCVEGEAQKKLFCTHIVKETDRWDIWHLVKNLRAFLNTENYRTFGEKYRKFYTAGILAGEDIFNFISRLGGYREDIRRLDDLAKEAGTTLGDPQLFESLQILTAIEKIPEYSFYSEKVLQMPSKEWIRLKPEDIRKELLKIHSNKGGGCEC